MKYLNYFSKLSDYQKFIQEMGGEEEPLVSYIEETNNSFLKPYINSEPAMVGDVAYWDGSKVKTTPLSSWDTSLGTAIGVVVIPSNILPDKKARIMNLYPINEHGGIDETLNGIIWGPNANDTILTNYSVVPITDNTGSISSGYGDMGMLPIQYIGENLTISFVDPKAYYSNDYLMFAIPSPYLGDDYTLNTDYCKELEDGNALSDFNGFSNTQTLIGLGADYKAAHACWEYNDGVSDLQWYLPSIGELGFLAPRVGEIETTTIELGGFSNNEHQYFTSSTESTENSYYSLAVFLAIVSNGFEKNVPNPVRPFALI